MDENISPLNFLAIIGRLKVCLQNSFQICDTALVINIESFFFKFQNFISTDFR